MIAAVMMSVECRVQSVEYALYLVPGTWNLEHRGR
jgi:hypothetical protein